MKRLIREEGWKHENSIILSNPITQSRRIIIFRISSNGEGEPDDLINDKPIIYFVADNQVHLYNGSVYQFENKTSKIGSASSSRPPQSTLFGSFAYETFLSSLNQSALLVHLGDACDISCPQELDRFFDAMDIYEGPWVFTPGNHDGYYSGNSQHKSSNKKKWEAACDSTRLDKVDVITQYLSRRFNKDIKRSVVGIEPVEGDTVLNNASVNYYAVINPDPDSAQESFIIQKVRYTTASGKTVLIILLDTSQYKNPPKYRHASIDFRSQKIAGFTGEILKNQKKIVNQWLDSLDSEIDAVFIAGHHPAKKKIFGPKGLAWLSGSRWLKSVLSKEEVVGYISAHTHKGGQRNLWEKTREWNIPSLVDWPLGMLEMRMTSDNLFDLQEVLYDDADRYPLSDCGSCADSADVWKVKPNDFHYYNEYLDPKNYNLFSPNNMHHYLLLAELESIVGAVTILGRPKDQYANDISEMRKFLIEAKKRYDSSDKDNSLKEIESIRPHVTNSMKLLESIKEQATTPIEQRRINQYFWCQLWWAAKTDAELQHGWEDATGRRELWPKPEPKLERSNR